MLPWASSPGPHRGWRVDLVEALLQLADCVPTDWWIAAIDAARHVPRGGEPLLSDADWEHFVKQVPLRLHPALAFVDPRSESVLSRCCVWR